MCVTHFCMFPLQDECKILPPFIHHFIIISQSLLLILVVVDGTLEQRWC